ncbi:hypothetical protein LSM04_009100 [Trypanosoma melophagium]|uniref:uncharacterized protein n=1 Tax=Trypanosoma melophagium TaxID=715481 RepID=UPI003519D908|nr:hypothetical protein LSM04_009100 [Trypanosoma melophagium]
MWKFTTTTTTTTTTSSSSCYQGGPNLESVHMRDGIHKSVNNTYGDDDNIVYKIFTACGSLNSLELVNSEDERQQLGKGIDLNGYNSMPDKHQTEEVSELKNGNQDNLFNIIRQKILSMMPELSKKPKLYIIFELLTFREVLNRIEAKVQNKELRLNKGTNTNDTHIESVLNGLRAELSEYKLLLMNLEKVTPKDSFSHQFAIDYDKKWSLLDSNIRSLEGRISKTIEVTRKLRGDMNLVSAQLINRLKTLENTEGTFILPSHETEKTINALSARIKSLEDGVHSFLLRFSKTDQEIIKLQRAQYANQKDEERNLTGKMENMRLRLEALVEESMQALQQNAERDPFDMKQKSSQRMGEMTDKLNEDLEGVASSLTMIQRKYI